MRKVYAVLSRAISFLFLFNSALQAQVLRDVSMVQPQSVINNSSASGLNVKILQSDTTICPGSTLKLSLINLRDGLVAFYPLDGNANDLTNNYNGTINGTVSFISDRNGIANRAMQGGGGYITASSSVFRFNYNDSFTVSLWLATNGTTSGRVLSTEYPEGNFRMGYDHSQGKIAAQFGAYFYTSINNNQWTHVVWTNNKGKEKIYINGLLSATHIETAFETLHYGAPFTIGAKASSAYDRWNGKIDDVGVWNRDLSSEDVSQLYNYAISDTYKYLWSTGDTTATINVSPLQTTTYYVTVTTGDTTFHDSVTVSVSNPSLFNPLEDTIRVCGSSIVLNAGSGNVSYMWNTGDSTQSISAKSSGNYKVTALDGYGCTVKDSTYLTFLDITLLQGDTSICPGRPVLLTSVSAFGSQVTYDFNDCTTSGIVGNGEGSFFSISGGQSGCGLSVVRPAQVRTIRSDFSYGTYEVYAKTGSSVSNQFLGILVSDDFVSKIGIDCRPSGTDDVGYGLYYNGVKLAGANTNPASAGTWYSMKIKYTPDSIKFWIAGQLLYQGLLPSIITENKGSIMLSAYDQSLYDNLVYIPYVFPVTYEWSTGETTPSITVQPTITTTYHVNFRIGSTWCTDSVRITVNDPGPFNPLIDTMRICGEETILSAGSGYARYLWSTGDTTSSILVNKNDKYQVTVWNAAGCSISDSTLLNIFEAEIRQGDTAICLGDSVWLQVTYSKNALQNGLVGYFPFDGTSLDQSGNGNHLEAFGVTTSEDRFGRAGKAYMFQNEKYSVTNYLKAIDHTKFRLPTYSYSIWFNTSKFYIPLGGTDPSYQGILSYSPQWWNYGPSYYFALSGIDNSEVELGHWSLNAAGRVLSGRGKIQINQWYHIVATYDGEILKLYLDGQLINQHKIVLTFDGRTQFLLGGLGDGPYPGSLRGGFNGKMDDLIMWNRALTSEEVSQLNQLSFNTNPFDIQWSTGEQDSFIVVKPTKTTTYYVTVSDGISSCRDSVTIIVNDPGLFQPLADTTKVCSLSTALNAGPGYTGYHWSTGDTTQSINTSIGGKYTVSAKDNFGCSVSDSTLLSLLNVKIEQDDTTLCLGSSLTLGVDCSSLGASITGLASIPSNLQNGLLAYYPFSCDARDVSGNGHDGVINGPLPTYDRFGNPNSALLFNGDDCCGGLNGYSHDVKIKDSFIDLKSDYSISCWMSSSDISKYDQILFNSIPHTGFAVELNNRNVPSKLTYGVGPANAFWDLIYAKGTKTNYQNNTWYNIVFVKSGTTYSIYVNGVLDGSSVVAASAFYTLKGGLHIGSIGNGFEIFKGSLDDVAVWGRALTSAEIQSIYSYSAGKSGLKYLWSTGDTTAVINVRPAKTTTYLLTIDNGISSCSDSMTVTVVDPAPYDPIPDTMHVCGRNTILDAGTGFSTYLWNTGETTQSISTSESGFYSVTVSNKSGCTISDSTYVNLLNVKILQKDTAVCPGTTMTLSVEAPVSGLQKGLVAFYPLDGNASDLTNNYSGTVNGSVSFITDRKGNANSAMQGGSGYITAPSSVFRFNYSDSFSVSLWLATNGSTSGRVLSTEYPEGNFRMGYDHSQGKIAAQFGEYFFTPITNNQWTHVVWTNKNGKEKLYINGQLSATQSETAFESLHYGASFTIGAKASSAYDQWNGKIDEVGVWNRELSSSEIESLYSSGLTGSFKYSWSTGDTTSTIRVSPEKTTTYYVNVSNGITTCLDSVTVTVKEPEIFNPLPDTVSMCGDVMTLDAGPGYGSYIWSTGETTRSIAAAVSGLYKVSVFNEDGCSISDSVFLSLLSVQILNNDTAICKGSILEIQSNLNMNDNRGEQYDFNNCDLNQFIVSLSDGNRDGSGNLIYGSVNISAQGQAGCGVQINWPASIAVQRSNFGYGTYEVDAKALDGTANQGLTLQVGVEAMLTVGVQPHNTDDEGWGIYYNGIIASVYNNNVPVSYPNWYKIKFQLTIDSLKYWLDNNLMYRGVNPGISEDSIKGIVLGSYAASMYDNLRYTPLSSSGHVNVIWSNGDTTQSITVSPAQTTTYFVTVSDGITSCRDSVTISVNDPGIFDPLSDTTRVCGMNAILDAGYGYAGYLWNTHDTSRSISPVASGLYRVTVTNGDGCSIIDSTYLSMLSADILQSDTAICSGTTLSLALEKSFLDLENGLVAYYPFNGNANDESGNGKNGFIYGANLTADRFNTPGSAYRFDGVNDYIETTLNAIPGNAYSISCWFKTDVIQYNEIGLVCSRTTFNHITGFSFIGASYLANFISYCSNSSNYGYATGTLNDSKWHQFVSTYDSGAVKLYFDGKLVYSGGTPQQLCILSNFKFGNDDILGGRYFSGELDDIGFWKRALTSEEVSSLFISSSQLNRYTYLWSTGDTTESIQIIPDKSTTYNVTVSDGISSCQDSITIYVKQPSTSTHSETACSSYTWNAQTYTESGTYTWTGTNAVGCDSVATLHLTINPLPHVNVNSGTICLGSSIQLVVTGADSYNWTSSTGLNRSSGDTVIASPTSTTTYQVIGTDANTGCSDTATATVTIKPLPLISVNSGAVCEGASMSLIASGGSTYSWYPSIGLHQTNGDTVVATPQSTTTYYVIGTDNITGCSDTATGSVTVKPLPVINVNSGTICAGGSLKLVATGGSTYSWSPSTDLNSATGDSVMATPTSTTNYQVIGTSSATGCSDTAISTVTVNPAPAAPSGTDGIRCGIGTVTLSASVPSGQSVSWYAASSGGTALAIGTTFTTPSISSTTIYYAQALITATGCVSLTRTPVTATVITALSSPTVTNNGRCGTGTVTLTAAAPPGATVAWFSSTTSATVLSTSTTYTTPSIRATTLYYVEARQNGCVSPRVAATATIYSVPAAPTAGNAVRCGPGTVTLSATPPVGATVDWWSASTGGTQLLTGNTSFTAQNINTTTTYYAASRLGNFTGCVSTTRTAVTATVNTIPAPPTANGVTRYCGAGTVILTALVPTGQTVAWFSAPVGGTQLATTLSYTTNSLSTDTAFYVEARTTTCSSAVRTRVPVSIIATGPPAPAADNVSRCAAGSVTLTANPPSGSTVAWFTLATGGTLLSTANPYVTASISSTTNYFVESRYSTTCVSATRTQVIATVNTLPAAPTAGTAASRCGPGSITVSAVPAANSTINWYSASTGGTLLASGTTTYTANVTATTTFYAASRNTITGCISSTRTAVTATVNALPAAPTSITGTLGVCPQSPITNYTYTSSTVRGVAGYVWTIPVCATGTSITNSIAIRLTGASTSDSIFVQTRNTAGCLSVKRGVKITTATTCSACIAPALITNKYTNADGVPTGEINQFQIKATPNPSVSLFRLELISSNRSSPIYIRIIDINGRVVEDFGRIYPGTVKMTGGNYRGGIYFVEAVQGNQQRKIKLVKIN